MTNAISGVAGGQPVYQPQHTAAARPEPKAPAGDAVTISSQGKQAVQLGSDGDTPAQEAMENSLQKAAEALGGKK